MQCLSKHTKTFSRILFLVWAAALILTVNIFRFLWLDQSPPGFHVDELAGGVTLQCLAENGVDALDNTYPLFADLNYGSPKPPTYIYPGMMWGKIFGYSISSLRSLTVVFALLTILGLFFLCRLMFDVRMALWVALVSTLSPWGFQISRIALESFLAPCLMIWGMVLFLKSHSVFKAIVAGIFFSLAMYSYPSARIHLPLLFFPILFLKHRWNGLKRREFLALMTACAVTTLPLALGIIQGQYMSRFQTIGIFSDQYLQSIGKTKIFPDLFEVFTNNYLQHLQPNFLFFQGDKNYVYGTGYIGICGWVEALALWLGLFYVIYLLIQFLLKKKTISRFEGAFIIVMWFGILSGIVPSALTWSDIPHSLRMLGSWPFLMGWLGYVYWKLTQRFEYTALMVCLLATVFMGPYLRDYFTQYPNRSYYMFYSYAEDMAKSCRSEEDWKKFIYIFRNENFHLRYYLMNYHEGQNCASTQRLWKQVEPLP